MTITVLGAGAIGGVIAAHLARAGRDVEIVDSFAEHVAAIRAGGLRIETPEGDFSVPVAAFSPDERRNDPRPLHHVLLCVKAQHTTAALSPLADVLAPDGYVVSIQNGLCESEIAEIVGVERTIGGFTNIFADWLAPGVVSYGGKGALSVGELDGKRTPRIETLADMLSCLDRIEISDSIMGVLWSKLAYGAMLTATALTDETIADLFDDPRYEALLSDLAGEVLEVAAHEGAPFVAFDDWDPALVHPPGRRDPRTRAQMAQHVSRLRGYSKTRSGIWRDIAVRKRRTEKHMHFATIFKTAERHGIAMPLCHALMDRLSRVEDGAARTIDNLESLRELDALYYGSEPGALK